ncbi:MAG: hypothetical protein A2219_07990 [Elusimicrobia bacterium RIFOXYA2_FULL_50_26]|nr:MAG: hypothetical protein A2219_07990 [Elusimicrobia bacterium RIFOXYA2_FULL_50_26]
MILVIMEIWSYVQVPLCWFLFRKLARRNVLGDMAAGVIIGCFWEYSTDALWTYHFKFNIYGDIPPGVPLGWGVMFACAVFVSEKLYYFLFNKNTIEPHDKRIFLTDILSAVLIGLPFEKFGLATGVWEYHYEILHWSPARIPVFDMPYEVMIGYCLLMLIAPTFVRYWQGTFE